MKHVVGKRWDRELSHKTLQENLEIFMKIADAVAFAHSRGILHRDIKPENVMLGGYGEVLLMDWGLAIQVGSASAKTAGVGGTPTYMAPEMATTPPDELSYASDVYLLGAVLYEIVTGNPPHAGTSVDACLANVYQNRIQPTNKTGELVSIALKAMATQPTSRYASTRRNCKRRFAQYQSHMQSILLSTRRGALESGRRSRRLRPVCPRTAGLRGSAELWEGNSAAQDGIARTSLAYAQRAMNKENFDLAASLLDETNAEHAALLRSIRAAN